MSRDTQAKLLRKTMEITNKNVKVPKETAMKFELAILKASQKNDKKLTFQEALNQAMLDYVGKHIPGLVENHES